MSGTDSNSSNPLGGANPTGSPGGATRKCTKCTITSQTAVSSPPDRARTTIGVGEEVNLTCSNSSVCVERHRRRGAERRRRQRHAAAGSTAGAVTVTATGPTCTCSIAFTVIAPSDPSWSPSRARISSTTTAGRTAGTSASSTCRRIRSPSRIWRSGKRTRSAWRWLLQELQQPHSPAGGADESAWFTMNDCVAGKGTLANLDDTNLLRCPAEPALPSRREPKPFRSFGSTGCGAARRRPENSSSIRPWWMQRASAHDQGRRFGFQGPGRPQGGAVAGLGGDETKMACECGDPGTGSDRPAAGQPSARTPTWTR